MKPAGATSHVREIIRKAEKHISAGELDSATKLLEDAKQTDPNNEYIGAILERVMLLSSRDGAASAHEVESHRIEPTVSVSLPKPTELPADNVQIQVQRLTAMAHNLYERGSYDTAFESLMKAYMLDPLSTDVEREESVIVPAFELMQKRGTMGSQADSVRPTVAQLLQQGLASNVPAPAVSGELSRIDQLKQQKEQERVASERAMWRKASEAPHAPETDEDSTSDPHLVSPAAPKHRDGIFARLRGGFHGL